MKYLWFLFRLMILVSIFAWFHLNPGTIEVRWFGYIVDVPIGVFALFLVMAMCTYLGFKNLNQNLGRFWKGLSWRRPPILMEHLAEPEMKQVLAMMGIFTVPRSVMNSYPSALHVPLEEGKQKRLIEYCYQLLRHKTTAWWGYWGIIHLYMQGNHHLQAYEMARQLQRFAPRSPEAVKAVFELAIISEEWGQALEYLSLVKKHAKLSRPQWHRYQALIKLMQVSTMPEGEQALRTIYEASQADPSFVPALQELTKRLCDNHKPHLACRIIEKNWVNTHTVALGQIYLNAIGDEGIKRYQHAERLTQKGGSSLVNTIFLAREAITAGLWGEAQRYLKRAVTHYPHRELMLLLAEAENELGNSEAYKQALEQANHLSFLPTWLCMQCGFGQEKYGARCTHCGSIDSLEPGEHAAYQKNVKPLTVFGQSQESLTSLTLFNKMPSVL